MATGGLGFAALGFTAMQIGTAIGGLTATAGVAAVIGTAVKDGENGTYTSTEGYLGNALKASLTVGGGLTILGLMPAAAKGLTEMILPYGLPGMTVPIFGKFITREAISKMANFTSLGIGGTNLFFQSNDMYLFFKDGKELGTPTGDKGYDTAKQITKGAASWLAFLGIMSYGNGVTRSRTSDRRRKPLENWSFDSKQLGKKWGKHKTDYPNIKSYTDYKRLS